jgi:L-threonylcarbamoyladenylate synthase
MAGGATSAGASGPALPPAPAFLWSTALRALRQGQLVAHPTEGVYGLACRARDATAVARLLRLKGRSAAKGFVVIAASLDDLQGWVEAPSGPLGHEVLASWPGPHTWLLPACPDLPGWLTGGRPTLAVRVTAHPLAAALAAAEGPLVSTSANPSGRPSAMSAMMVRRYFPDAGLVIVPGRLGNLGHPTSIRDGRDGRWIRGNPSWLTP